MCLNTLGCVRDTWCVLDIPWGGGGVLEIPGVCLNGNPARDRSNIRISVW